VFRTKNSLKSTEFRPVQRNKNKTINTKNSHYTSEKCEATREKILEMNRRKCPCKKSYSDKIFPKDWPTKSGCKFPSLLKCQYPDKYPSDATRKGRSNHSPQFQKDIICAEVQGNSCEEDKHFCLRTTTCREDLKIYLQEEIK